MKYSWQGIRSFYKVSAVKCDYRLKKWSKTLKEILGKNIDIESPAGTVVDIIEKYGANNE